MRLIRKQTVKNILILIAVLMIVVLTGVAFASSLKTKSATSFESNGNKIAGWYWCRSSSHYAIWTFQTSAVYPKEACINFTVLVTNKASGGSGFDCNPTVELLDLNGVLLETRKVKLINPFRPIWSSNSGGLGYTAYGSFCSKHICKIMQTGGFKIRVIWPPSPKYHFACKKTSATLAYILK